MNLLPLIIFVFLYCKPEKFPEYKVYLYKPNNQDSESNEDKNSYIQKLEKENKIDFSNIKNPTAYIPPMCYTNTKDKNGLVHNPCYTCHTVGSQPNFVNDIDLQTHYDFPDSGKVNPWKNLFNPPKSQGLSDLSIQKYIEEDNYLNSNKEIYLSKNLPKNWEGYIPDCYFHFDEEGFDKNPKTGEYTGWRAYRYYPFPGTFWATNGSTDDVLIRLPFPFRANIKGKFDLEIYKTNLTILESLVKQKSIKTEFLEEGISGIDLDGNGKLEKSNSYSYNWPSKPVVFAGLAEYFQNSKEVVASGGLFPVGTEFLHSVRYVSWDNTDNQVKLSPRMKELRYAVKKEFYNYAELRNKISRELKEARFKTEKTPEGFYGDYEHGFDNKTGWSYLGFIEDRNGNLRPQTNEETLFCMGCHSSLGVLADSNFSFQRKLEGSDKSKLDYGWGHWSNKSIFGLSDRIVSFKNFGEKREYSFYLENNKAGDEFRENEEIKNLFFNSDGSQKSESFTKLKSDISFLISPSFQRSVLLNKSYKSIVESQSFRFGRDSILQKPKNVLPKVSDGQVTNIEKVIF